MATTEPGTTTPASPSDVGRHLRAVRKAKGLSRAEVARSAGLTRRELAAYERGRSPVPDSDLWCLAGSCGVDVGELLPPGARLEVGSDLAALTVGESIARLRPTPGDGSLREYLAMVYELRNLPPGAKPPMRDDDLATLAEALGGSPDAIEARLHELIGASRDEAARLRSMILPPLPIAAPAVEPFAADAASVPAPPVAVPVAVGAVDSGAHLAAAPTELPPSIQLPPLAATPTDLGAPPETTAAPVDGFAPSSATPVADPVPAPEPPLPAYPPPAFDFASAAPTIGDPAATDRFFAMPQADDPFAPPPPLDSLVPPAGGFAPPADPAFSPPDAFPAPGFDASAPVDPFGIPTGPPLDPFAPPSGPPLDAGAPVASPLPVDPFGALAPPAAPVRPDGFVADLGDDLVDPILGAPAPVPDEDPFAGVGPELPIDPFGAVEMVTIDVGDDGMVIDTAPHAAPLDAAPLDATFDTASTPDDTTADAPEDDDPFAILRIPVEDAEVEPLQGPDDADPGWASAFTDFGADEPTPPGDDMDVFTRAFDPVVGGAGVDVADVAADVPAPAPEDTHDEAPALAAETEVARHEVELDLVDDDEPSDDWFDRAAAAADALIAEQRHDPTEQHDDGTEQDDDGMDLHDDGTQQHDDGTDLRDDSADLPPIAWSLAPPPAAPAPEPEPSAPADQFVAAGSDWQVGGIFPATAMADDGTLALRRADVRWALADITAEGDFTVRATVDFTSGAGFGILFRVSTDDSERITGYSFDVDPIYSGGGFLVRQWNDSRQHWKPLAHAPVADTARLYGAHVIEVSLRNDVLTASIDGETVMHVPQLSRCSIDGGHEPCRGGRIGVQAWSTTEVTVDRLMVAQH